MPRNQAADAQDLYDDRSSKYDDSHHPRFARHMVELANPQPGEHVLDLACGTGLVSYSASIVVGPSGEVIAIDISTGMLQQAEAKKATHEPRNVTFFEHSITDLDSLEVLEGKQFDIITCCSALVLLEHPGEALKQWATYLKPGGRIVTDVTHPQNLTSGVVFEQVGRIMERPLPWYRVPFQKPEDLQTIMEAAGLHPVEVYFISQLGGEEMDNLESCIQDFAKPKVHGVYEVSDADGIFNRLIDGTPMKALASPPDVRTKAKEVFTAQWEKAADADGKVREIDGVFVGIGRKP